mgnify:CR=1 FL=1
MVPTVKESYGVYSNRDMAGLRSEYSIGVLLVRLRGGR